MLDPLALTQALVAKKSINPPGDEAPIAQYLRGLLEPAGFACQVVALGENRASLIAKFGAGAKPALCLTGHMDTVPLGQAPWTKDPFAGQVEGDRLYGRGTSDMKGGLAVMVCSVVEAVKLHPDLELVLVITSDEEIGCQGAKLLWEQGYLNQPVGAVLVCEPTGNLPDLGHKGSLWLEAICRGVTAHGSTPELGVNAVYLAAQKVLVAKELDLGPQRHALYGRPTLNVGSFKGGMNINSVPDRASFTLDIRTLPSMSHGEVTDWVQKALGPEVELRWIIDAEAVEVDPNDPWIKDCLDLLQARNAEPVPIRGGVYVTDASVLWRAYGRPPVMVLGPGDFSEAHKTDESCSVSKLYEAKEIYLEILGRWAKR